MPTLHMNICFPSVKISDMRILNLLVHAFQGCSGIYNAKLFKSSAGKKVGEIFHNQVILYSSSLYNDEVVDIA